MEKVSLGRMAVFLIPAKKLSVVLPGGVLTIEQCIQEFLLSEYGGFTASSTTTTGWWKGKAGDVHYDEHREYKVSFPGKERIKRLDGFLAMIAKDINEECIYVETGEDAWLVYPT